MTLWCKMCFLCSVKRENVCEVKRELKDNRVSALETFDVKFTKPREGGKRLQLDMKIAFEAGKPKILLTKKNDSRIVVFDVLCLHRYYFMNVHNNYPS